MVIWLTPSPSTFHVVYEWPLALTGITVSWLLHNIILWFTRNILVQWEVFLLKTWCTVEGVCNKYFVIEVLLQIGLALWEGYVTSNHHNQSMFTKAWAQWKVYVVAQKWMGSEVLIWCSTKYFFYQTRPYTEQSFIVIQTINLMNFIANC